MNIFVKLKARPKLGSVSLKTAAQSLFTTVNTKTSHVMPHLEKKFQFGCKLQLITRRCIRTDIRHYQKKLIVSPASSHTSSNVEIIGNGFEPESPVTIQGTLICPDEGLDFQSYAHVYTDCNGCFDMATTESLGGTYTGVHDMGLFWSLEKRETSLFYRAGLNDGSRELHYQFKTYHGHVTNLDDDSFTKVTPTASATCQRYAVSAARVERIPLNDGRIFGTLFLPKINKEVEKDDCGEVETESVQEKKKLLPVIITMTGGVKRGGPPEHYAAFFAHHGYATLALAFFGVKGMEKSYKDSPIRIEYFEEAVELLRAHESIDSDRVGVIGLSKAGDLALSMMQHLPQVKAVCYVNGSIATVETPTTYQGHTTPDLPSNLSRVTFQDESTVNISQFYDSVCDHPQCIVRFEESGADLLMVVGSKDLSWNGEEMADVAEFILKQSPKQNYKIIRYPELGHFVELPNFPISGYDNHPLVPRSIKLYMGEGGKDDGTASKEISKVWKDVLDFFDHSFGHNCNDKRR